LRQSYNPDAYAIAEFYALLGEMDPTLEWLAKALERHDFALAFVKVNPVFESLHNDQRFRELLVRAGFASQNDFR